MDRLDTDAAGVEVKGFVLGGAITSASLLVNGTEQGIGVLDGDFSATLALRPGLTRIQARIEALDPHGNPVSAVSALVQIIQGAGDGTGAIAGRLTDEATGYPIPGAEVRIPALGLSRFTDRFGVWEIGDLPAGDLEIEVVP